jgi:hypothetical protein
VQFRFAISAPSSAFSTFPLPSILASFYQPSSNAIKLIIAEYYLLVIINTFTYNCYLPLTPSGANILPTILLSNTLREFHAHIKQ